MGLSISYMGTKRKLAPIVAQVLNASRSGILLDTFAGMCSVGESVAANRNVWNNDIQIFASEVARALFNSEENPLGTLEASGLILESFKENEAALEKMFLARLEFETLAYQSNNLEVVTRYLADREYIENSSRLKQLQTHLAQKPRSFPYCLASITFSDGYFGLRQSIEIDSIRYSLDYAKDAGKLSSDAHRWLLIALCQTAAKIAATTGHFAQYLEPNSNNLSYYINQRTRSVWNVWLESVDMLEPIGTKHWRAQNRVFNCDSLTLLKGLVESNSRPDVIYADPPYTEDQYSRYYHVWETLVKYDYPSAKGKGRYRSDRFSTPFSKSTTIVEAFNDLIFTSAKIKAEFVLSYPENGLLRKNGIDPIDLLKKHYKKVEVGHCGSHSHSTFGASNGVSSQAVNEIIYWAR